MRNLALHSGEEGGRMVGREGSEAANRDFRELGLIVGDHLDPGDYFESQEFAHAQMYQVDARGKGSGENE